MKYPSRPTKTQRAIEALLDVLADGEWHLSRDVLGELERRGLGVWLTYRAAALCGVEMRPAGGPGGRRSTWRLAPGTPPPDPAVVDRRRQRRPRSARSGPAPHGEGACCRLCGAPLGGRYYRALTCSPARRIEASRLRALLAGNDAGRYRSVADRLAADVTPGSALARVLAAAGLERQGA